MASLGFGDVQSLAQTVGIIATLVLTLYFSRKQIKTMAADIETRVLSDLDEKQHNLIELFVDSPQLVKTMWDVPSKPFTAEMVVSYYAMYIGAHAYHKRQRKILCDNEWADWLQWLKNSFQYGDMGKNWKDAGMESWFDPLSGIS